MTLFEDLLSLTFSPQKAIRKQQEMSCLTARDWYNQNHIKKFSCQKFWEIEFQASQCLQHMLQSGLKHMWVRWSIMSTFRSVPQTLTALSIKGPLKIPNCLLDILILDVSQASQTEHVQSKTHHSPLPCPTPTRPSLLLTSCVTSEKPLAHPDSSSWTEGMSKLSPGHFYLKECMGLNLASFISVSLIMDCF